MMRKLLLLLLISTSAFGTPACGPGVASVEYVEAVRGDYNRP